jgi:hypothetical protein
MHIRKFATLQEIRDLPGFSERVTEVAAEAPTLLGYYVFSDFAHCSKPDCTQKRGFGYVLQTEDGKVMGLGGVCGAQLFGAHWDGAGYTKQIKQIQLHDTLAKSLSELPAQLEKIDALIYGPRGAKWLELAERSLAATVPMNVMQQLHSRASRGDVEVLESKQRLEGDFNSAARGDAVYVNKLVGSISGISAMARPSPRMILAEQLRDPLKPFLNVTADDLLQKPSQRRFFVSLIEGLEERVQLAERRLADAVLFFETSNLRLLSNLAKSPVEQLRLALLRWNDTSGLVETR